MGLKLTFSYDCQVAEVKISFLSFSFSGLAFCQAAMFFKT